MRIPPILFGSIVLVLFLGTIFGFQAAGIWSISGKITGDGQAVLPSAGDVNTIKGWMTLEQISIAYNVPLDDILMQFSLPGDTPASTAIKDLESDAFSVTNLRTWLESRMQSPQPEVTVPPSPQVTLLTSKATETAVVTSIETTATPLPTQHIASEKTISGKTTFQELLDWGVELETIQQVIGADLPAPATVIKDYVTQKGLQFSTVKTALQAEVDQLK